MPEIKWSIGRQVTIVYGERFGEELLRLSGDKSRIFDPYGRNFLFVRELILASIVWIARNRRTGLMDIYFQMILMRARPKRVFTCILGNDSFLRVRHGLPTNTGIRFYIFQTGEIWLDEMPQEWGMRPGDVVFSLTESYARAWKIRAGSGVKVVSVGSLPSVMIKDASRGNLASFDRQSRAGFISSWRAPIVLDGKNVRLKRTGPRDAVPYEHFFQPEISMLPSLVSTLNRINLRLEVMGNAPEESSAAEEELHFYEEILGPQGQGWSYAPRPKNSGSYGKLPLFNVIFAVDSSLATEALSMGYLVVLLEVGASSDVRFPFGYPEEIKNATNVLLSDEVDSWDRKIKILMELEGKEREEIFNRAVGESVLNSRIGDITSLL